MLAGASVCAAFTGLGISESHRNTKSWTATKLADLLHRITNIEPVRFLYSFYVYFTSIQ